MLHTRPDNATHTDDSGNYYRHVGELNWLKYDRDNGWFNCGTNLPGSLIALAPSDVVEPQKFDAPTAVATDPHGVYKVQLTRWQAEDGSFHESYEDAVRHGVFKDLQALMHEFMDNGEIEVEPFIASLLEHYELERK